MSQTMARIRHIAVVTDDPSKTAEYYKSCFGLQELFRKPADTGADGVWLSDGYIYFALVKNDTPSPVSGKPIKGIHHIGFHVKDMEGTRNALKAASTKTLDDYVHPANRPMEKYSQAENLKCIGPDGVMFDVRAHGWDEAIRGRMQLYELSPVADKRGGE